MPGHPDEEGAVVSPIGGPPRFGVGHEGNEIFFDFGEIQFLKLLGIVKALPHGIGLLRV
jgi:hypothetical protein